MSSAGILSLSKTLLPPTAADLRHLLDRAIPRARPWSPSRHTCRFVWGHHDGRAPCRGRIVERDCVVDRDAGAVGVERRDQAAAGCRVICRRLRPRVGHDILRGGSARWCLTTWSYQVPDASPQRLLAIVAHDMVADTNGFDRGRPGAGCAGGRRRAARGPAVGLHQRLAPG